MLVVDRNRFFFRNMVCNLFFCNLHCSPFTPADFKICLCSYLQPSLLVDTIFTFCFFLTVVFSFSIHFFSTHFLSMPSPKKKTPSSPKKKTTSPKKKAPVARPLPKLIRDELRMTAALRCYSSLLQGRSRKIKELQHDISEFAYC